VLSLPIVLQRVQMIPRWNLEIIKLRRQVHILQFPDSTSCNIGREALDASMEEQVTCAAIGERLDHGFNVSCHVTRVNARYGNECRLTP
jgi:hypothetical protein